MNDKNLATAALAVMVVSALCILPHDALAQAAGDIGAGFQRGFNWALAGVRAAAAIIFMCGFLLFAGGRWHWAGAVVMVGALLGASKSDAISQYIMGA